MKTYPAKAFGSQSANSDLSRLSIPRREPLPKDVQIKILYCGVCHSDLHQVRDEWNEVMPTVYPCVPGHDFCAEHYITSDIELIRVDQINDAYKRLLKSDVKYRFVIDIESLQ